MVSDDKKGNVVHHFYHADFGNTMVPLTILSTSHDANTYAVASHDTNASGILIILT